MQKTEIDFSALQASQQGHDLQNHFDILALHKMERLKHYGLHFAKYVGRLARGSREPKSPEQTATDAFLVVLSTANTLNQRLSTLDLEQRVGPSDILLEFASAAGRFADACEKMDHLEEFRELANVANRDILKVILSLGDHLNVDLVAAITARRRELYERQAYHDQGDSCSGAGRNSGRS